jgi:tripartite motif-containing protein 71
MSTCTNCGRNVDAGRMICECGSLVAAGATPTGLPTLARIGIGLPAAPKLDLSLKGAGLEQGLAPAPASIDLSGLDLSTTERAAQGKPYRPVFAVSTPEDGSWGLRMPFALASLPDGGFYVIGWVTADGPARLQEFDLRGQWVRSVRDFDEGDGEDELDTPADLATDEQRNLYLLDMGTSEVKKFSPDGKLLARFGHEGSGPQELSGPRRLAVGPGGKMVVADAGNNRVVVWDGRGDCSTILGINREDDDGGWMMAGDQPGEFNDPQGVALDAAGDIFVADTGNHRIQTFDATGKPVLVFGTVGDAAGELSYPQAIRVSKAGDIFVTDRDGARVQKFDPEGRFVYQVFIPESAGSIEDIEVDSEGRILEALRKANLVLLIEVQ